MATRGEHADSVTTVDYRNKAMWGSEGYGYWWPRWIRVRISSRTGDTGLAWVAEPNWTNEKQLEVALVRCACGAEFACQQGMVITKCKACDQRARAASQRKRRLKQRLPGMAKHCAHCGAGMAAKRRTRKYCSGACRIAAMRQKD